MPTHHNQDDGDRSDSHTQSPMPNSSRRTWDVVIADDESNTPPRKRLRLKYLGCESSSDGAPKVRRRLTPEAYTVAWVAALPLEMAAATAMLDEIHEPLTMSSNDSNLYVFGNIGDHNVVIACLPSGQYGIAKAALVANNMRWSFPSIKIRLMVGIGGGVPGKLDIRLGDVVVSNPTLTSPGVIQYDFGKTVQEGRFQLSGALNKPPQELLAAVAKLRANHESQPSQIPVYLAEMVARNPSMTAYTHQGAGQDRLYEAAYDHTGDSCDDCDLSQLFRRQARSDNHPRIHYGVVASANQVMKHGQTRDRLAQEHDVICFEMEAAGLMDSFPCLVIRGICDYSDSHKVKRWQEYAASTAAAYAKELLTIIPQSASKVDQMNYQMSTPNISSRSAIMESMKFDQMDNRHSTIGIAYAKTCQWLAKHPDYVCWLDPRKFASHHGVLWISGKPGAGKSTIMKFAFTQAKRKAAKNAAVLSFFFNARGEHLEKTIEGMHRSLLVQLLEKFPELQEVLEDSDLPTLSHYSSDPWNLSVLEDIFSRAISKLGQRQVTCFIDALDECAEDEVRKMLDFLEGVGQCAAQNSIKFYVCFSSRHYPQIKIQYGIRFTLEDQSGHQEDLEAYVRSKLSTGTTKQDEVTTEILQKASGVFMWVVLVIDILNKEFQRGRIFAVKKRLREIPPKLSDLFRDILTRDGENMDDLLLAVQWVLFGKRPLRREEFYFALVAGLEPDSLAQWEPDHVTEDLMNRFVVSSSKGLAEMTKTKNPTVQFIHESVRDFLLKDDGLSSLWPNLGENPEGKSHERLKNCCFAYTRVNTSPHVPSIDLLSTSSVSAKALRAHAAKKFPFLEYATNQVLYHANVAARLAVAQDQFVQEFATALQDWIQLNNLFEPYMIRRYTRDATVLYIVVDGSLASLIEPVARLIPQSKVSPKERYGTPLSAAVHSNNSVMIRALLPHVGLDEIDSPGEGRRTPLWTAMKNGRAEIVEMLLGAGANPNALDSKGLPAISCAIKQGNKGIVKMLLEAGADLESVGHRHGPAPIFFATQRGDEDMVRFLLDAGAKYDALAYDLPVILSVIAQGNIAMVKLLLFQDFSARNAEDTSGNLSTPGTDLQERYRQLRIRSGVDVNRAYEQYGTALHFAVEHQHLDLATLLLDAGADVNSHRVTSSKSPLHHFIHHLQVKWNRIESSDHLKVVSLLKLLLERGADVNALDENGRSTVEAAVELGDAAILGLLLEAGATFDAYGKNDWNLALRRAFGLGKREIYNFLIQEGADVNHLDTQGCSMLETALQAQNFSSFESLIDAGADIKKLSKDNLDAALGQAVRSRNNPVCKILLRGGADVDTRPEGVQGQTILHFAARDGDTDTLETLLVWGADFNCTEGMGKTPLHLACATRATAITTTLIQKGANFRAADRQGESPIFTAVRSGYSEQLELLLRFGANANQRNKLGNTPLFEACKLHNVECGRILIKSGADATLVNRFGDNALFEMCFAGGLLQPMLNTGVDVLHRNNSGHLFFQRAYGDVDTFLELAGPILITPSEDSTGTNAIKKLIGNLPIRDSTAKQLLEVARTQHNSVLVRLLVDRGGHPSPRRAD